MNVPIASQNINFPGYGMFWVANSISSTLLGLRNRSLQEKAQERNLDFQKEMERARFATDDVKLQEEIAFKRRMMALSREYRQELSIESFKGRMKAIELKHYLQYCWPLDPSLPHVLLAELQKENSLYKSYLNTILLRNPFFPLKGFGLSVNDKDEHIYDRIEYLVKNEDEYAIKDIHFHKDASLVVEQSTGRKNVKHQILSGNSAIMNIHFLMNQLPTLVISPQYRNGKMYFTGAVWEPQAARPLIRPLLDYDFDPEKAEKDEEYQKQMVDLFHACVSVITGTVRDSYMLLTQGKTPTLPEWLNDDKHKEMKQLVLQNEQVHNFISRENENIRQALEAKNMPNLLEVFDEADIEVIKKQVSNPFEK